MRPLKRKPNKIDKNKYYIVDSLDLSKPRLLWNEFNLLEEADTAILEFLNNSTGRYSVCKGTKALFHQLTFYWDLTEAKNRDVRTHWIEITKYRVPPRLKHNLNARKHYRRLIRRRLRNLNQENY